MRMLLPAALIVFVALFGAALAQDANQTAPPAPADLCAGVSCNPSSVTCADGFVSSCTNSCDSSTGKCSQCSPSCEGHNTPPPTVTNTTATLPEPLPTCPTTPPKPECPNGRLETRFDAKRCVTGYDCIPYQNTTTRICPAIVPSRPDCPNGEIVTKYDADRCVTGYECVQRETRSCPELPSPTPEFCKDGNVVRKYDDKGCATGYDCKPFETPRPQPVPRNDYRSASWECYDGSKYKQSDACKSEESWKKQAEGLCSGKCSSETGKCGVNSFNLNERCEPSGSCGNGICEPGEEKYCREDCIEAKPFCPATRSCSDGSSVSCKQDGDRCFCETCPLPEHEVPRGCRQVVDKEKGFVKVVCDEQVCQRVQNAAEMEARCTGDGGVFSLRKDPNGCEFPECKFDDSKSNPFAKSECRQESEEQIEATRKSCEGLGLNLVFTTRGGCKISKCSDRPQNACPMQITEKAKRDVEAKCAAEGLGMIKTFEDGCPVLKCEEANYCQREVPKDAYEKCGSTGGELVAKRDHEGCVVFTQCVSRGDERNSYIDDIKGVPDPSELLSIAFKMEELKIEFDKLSRKTDDIANYYAASNSPDEGRYRRVADMFLAARDEVDDIRLDLRDRLDDITEDDLFEIKSDVRHIKDVVMKDILYLMLSTSDEVKEIDTSSGKNCRSDEECFDRAFRLCQQGTKFEPDGREGPIIEVKGLEGDKCVIYASLPEDRAPPAGFIPGINPPYEMTCKIPNYALGIRDPEKDAFPYCEGNMLELMKKFEGGPPGVPGKCAGDECRKYCPKSAETARECLEHLGPYLPADAKQGLEAIASGKTSGFGPSSRGGGGEFRDEFRGEEFRGGGEFRDFNEGGEFRSGPGEFRGEFEEREFRSPEEFRGSNEGGFERSGGGF